MSCLFNSFDPYFKQPFGAVRAGQTVRLSLRIPEELGYVDPHLVLKKEGKFDVPVYYRMNFDGQTPRQNHFSVEVPLNDPGLYFYYFDLYTDFRRIVRGPDNCGVISWQDGESWQITVYEQDFETPESIKGKVFYQIFPDRFCNGTPEKNGADIEKWRTGPVSNAERFGGNLEGIRKKLPYLHDLGISGIYLNPIMEAESTHKYDTRDYTKIDPQFGTNEEFARLVKEAHAHGIRIMVDAVFNHCGRSFGPWADVVEKKSGSPYADWFMIQDWDAFERHGDTRDGRFYSFAFTDRMPKLNTNNPEVIRYFCQVCKRWIREFDIDGIRFDVGNEVSHRFLKELRRQLKSVKPDLYLLGEIWHDASQWLGGDEYDSVMNYPLTSGIQDFFLDQAAEKDEFEYMVNRCYTMYMQQNNNVIFNLLDSHDTERLMNRCQDLDIFYQQLAILFTMPGSPCIYYGTEIALEGAHDPDCRRCMPWDEIDSAENQKKIELMKSLIRMRIQEDACRSLYFDFPHKYSQKRCVEYRKLNLDGKWIEVLLNCGSEPIEIQGQGEILFARRCEGNSLDVRGTLIRRLPSTV